MTVRHGDGIGDEGLEAGAKEVKGRVIACELPRQLPGGRGVINDRGRCHSEETGQLTERHIVQYAGAGCRDRHRTDRNHIAHINIRHRQGALRRQRSVGLCQVCRTAVASINKDLRRIIGAGDGDGDVDRVGCGMLVAHRDGEGFRAGFTLGQEVDRVLVEHIGPFAAVLIDGELAVGARGIAGELQHRAGVNITGGDRAAHLGDNSIGRIVTCAGLVIAGRADLLAVEGRAIQQSVGGRVKDPVKAVDQIGQFSQQHGIKAPVQHAVIEIAQQVVVQRLHPVGRTAAVAVSSVFGDHIRQRSNLALRQQVGVKRAQAHKGLVDRMVRGGPDGRVQPVQILPQHRNGSGIAAHNGQNSRIGIRELNCTGIGAEIIDLALDSSHVKAVRQTTRRAGALDMFNNARFDDRTGNIRRRNVDHRRIIGPGDGDGDNLGCRRAKVVRDGRGEALGDLVALGQRIGIAIRIIERIGPLTCRGIDGKRTVDTSRIAGPSGSCAGVDIGRGQGAGDRRNAGNNRAIVQIACFCHRTFIGACRGGDHRAVIGPGDGDGDNLRCRRAKVVRDGRSEALGDLVALGQRIGIAIRIIERIGPLTCRGIDGKRTVDTSRIAGPSGSCAGVDIGRGQGAGDRRNAGNNRAIVQIACFCHRTFIGACRGGDHRAVIGPGDGDHDLARSRAGDAVVNRHIIGDDQRLALGQEVQRIVGDGVGPVCRISALVDRIDHQHARINRRVGAIVPDRGDKARAGGVGVAQINIRQHNLPRRRQIGGVARRVGLLGDGVGECRSGLDHRRIIGAGNLHRHRLDIREDAVIDPDFEGERDDFAFSQKIHGSISDRISPVDLSARGRGRFHRDAAGGIETEARQQRIKLRHTKRAAIVQFLRNHRAGCNLGVTGLAEIRVKEADRAGGGDRIVIYVTRLVDRFDDVAGGCVSDQIGSNVAGVFLGANRGRAFAATGGVFQQTQGLGGVAFNRRVSGPIEFAAGTGWRLRGHRQRFARAGRHVEAVGIQRCHQHLLRHFEIADNEGRHIQCTADDPDLGAIRLDQQQVVAIELYVFDACIGCQRYPVVRAGNDDTDPRSSVGRWCV